MIDVLIRTIVYIFLLLIILIVLFGCTGEYKGKKFKFKGMIEIIKKLLGW